MESLVGLMMLFVLAFGAFLTIVITVATLFIFLYAIYDVLANQRGEMEPIEQILWVLVILFFNVAGAIAYLVIVKIGDIKLTSSANKQKIGELEELAELREKEAITEEEYQDLKDEILDEKK